MSRPAGPASGCRSAARLLVALGALGAVAGLTVPAASAAPLRQARDAGPSLRLTVTQMEPRDLVGDPGTRQLTFSGRISNTGRVTVQSVRLRVQRGPVIITRSDLHQTDDAGAPFLPIRSCPWLSPHLPHGLAPGASVRFAYHCDLATLDMTLIGIYPLALRAQAGTDAAPAFAPAGEVRTYLPSFPQGVTARTQVDWLWPLVDRPHRLADGPDRFLDDDLGRSVAPGGRLDRLLSLAEHAPRQVRLTLVVDPALVDALDQMGHGYQVRSGRHWVAGRYSDAASSWLDRLRRLTTRYPLAALPYGDPDVVALRRIGAADLARITPADRALIADRLGTTPITTLAWPPGDAVTPEALTTLVGQGFQAVVLGSAALPRQPVTGPTPGSVTRLHGPGVGQAVALVTDPDLSETVQDARGFAEGPRLAEQRYLTELGMITAEAPSRGRDLVVAPPRRWDPDPESVRAMLADTATLSWLTSGSAAELAQHLPEVDRGPLVYPAAARRAELPRALVDGLVGVRDQVRDFRTAPVGSRAAQQVVSPYEQAVRRAASSAWRTSAGGPTYLAGLRAQVARLRASVHIVKPSGSGVYVLASSNSPLILTVANDLGQPVRFRIQISSRGTSGFTVRDIGEQVIQARTRRTIQIPARVERSGLFVVDALVTTPAGQPLGVDGQPVRLKVRSTAYGLIGLVITGIALAVLLLLVLRRLVIQLGRRGAGSDTRRPADGAQPGLDRPADTGPDGAGEGPVSEPGAALGAPARAGAPLPRSRV